MFFFSLFVSEAFQLPTCWWNRNIQLFAFDKKTNIIFCYLSLAKLKGEDLRLDARRLENECAFIDAYYVYKLLAYEISYRACNFLSTFKSRMRKMRIVETKQNNKKTKHDANFYWIMYYILSFDFLLLWILIIIMIHQKNQNNWNSRFFFFFIRMLKTVGWFEIHFVLECLEAIRWYINMIRWFLMQTS